MPGIRSGLTLEVIEAHLITQVLSVFIGVHPWFKWFLQVCKSDLRNLKEPTSRHLRDGYDLRDKYLLALKIRMGYTSFNK